MSFINSPITPITKIVPITKDELKSLNSEESMLKEQIQIRVNMYADQIYNIILKEARQGKTTYTYKFSNQASTSVIVFKPNANLKPNSIDLNEKRDILPDLLSKLKSLFPDSNVTLDDQTSITVNWS